MNEPVGSFMILPVGSDDWLRARGASQGKGMEEWLF